MKKFIKYLFAATAVILGMAACGDGPDDNGEKEPGTPTGPYAVTFSETEHGSAVAKVSGREISEAEEGTVVSVIATLTTDAADDYEFTGWTVVSDNVELADASASTTSFMMPAAAVELKANFTEKTIPKYAVTFSGIENGSTGATIDGEAVTEAPEGAVVAVAATAAYGYDFSGWTVVSGNAELADASAATTTFTMPAEAVELTASFTQTPSLHTITLEEVTGGTFAAYVDNQKVTQVLSGTVVQMAAIASSPVVGTKYEFVDWTITPSTVTISPKDATTAYFTMPRGDVSVRANFRERNITYYNVVCEQTEGGVVKAFIGQTEVDKAEAYTRMRITATENPGYEWIGWACSSNVRLDNSTITPATFAMPAADIVVKASFRKIVRKVLITTESGGKVEMRVDDKIVPSGSTIEPGTTVSVTAIPQISNTNGDYVFAGWDIAPAVPMLPSMSAITATFTMPDDNVNVVARFSRKVPTGSETPDERFIGTWRDVTGCTVTIGANSIRYRNENDKGYDVGSVRWNPVTNSGQYGSPTLAAEHPTGYRLEGGINGVSGILPWREDGRGGAGGDISFEWWYINAAGTQLMPGRNPTEASGGKGPFIKQ